MQKSASKVTLKDKHKSYNETCLLLDLDNLKEIRQQLCTRFAIKAAKNLSIYFNKNYKIHIKETRHKEEYKVTHCNTERLMGRIIFGRKLSKNLKVDFFFRFQHIWVALCLPGEILTTHKT